MLKPCSLGGAVGSIRTLMLILAWSGGVAFAPCLRAQSSARRIRAGLAGGVSSYSGNFDVAGAGVLARVALRLESPQRPLSAQLEGGYHRFHVLYQACPACPGCACSPQSPPDQVWSIRLSGQWHVRGVPGGLYATGGVGAYSPVAAPGQPSGAAVGFDLGVGVRRSGRGPFAELRLVRLRNAPTTAWLVPLTLGVLL